MATTVWGSGCRPPSVCSCITSPAIHLAHCAPRTHLHGTVPDAPSRLASALADRYRIEREIGAGGMATVYLAYDLRHDRKVAIKVLRPELAAAIGADRFLAEIRTTANLQHPNILPLFDSGAATLDAGPSTHDSRLTTHDCCITSCPSSRASPSAPASLAKSSSPWPTPSASPPR